MTPKQIIEELTKHAIKDVQALIEKRGHKLTGKLINSFKYEIKLSQDKVESFVTWEAYGQHVEKGVQTNRIPFTIRRRGQGRGGKSKLVSAIEDYVKKRGFRSSKKIKTPLQAAFAIIISAKKKKGFPTEGSRKFSKDKKRGFVVRDGLAQAEPKLVIKLEESYLKYLQLEINDLVGEINAEVNS